MDAGTSEVIINGNTLFSGRSHGITDRGVGRLLTSYNTNSSNYFFTLYDISVVAPVVLPLVLDVDLENKTEGNPIDTCGASVDEPVEIPNDIDHEVNTFGASNRPF